MAFLTLTEAALPTPAIAPPALPLYPPLPRPRLHPVARLLICVIGAVVMAVVVTVVIAAAVSTAALITTPGIVGHPDPGAVQQRISDFFTNNQLLVNLLLYPSILLWLWFCRRALDRRSFVSLGLRPRRGVRDLSLGVIAGTAAVSALFGLLWLLAVYYLNGFPALSWSSTAFDSTPLAIVSMLILYAFAFCCVGFMEEVSFRGYVLHNLTAWLGLRAAIITQAVLFALVHIANVVVPLMKRTPAGLTLPSPAEAGSAIWDIRWGIINIALIGVFFALCYVKTGSLWFPIGFHIAWNFFLGCIYSLPVSGIDIFHLFDIRAMLDVQNSLITGGDFGGEGSVLLAPIIATMIYLMVKNNPTIPQALLDLGLLTIPVPSEAIAETETSDEPRFSAFKSRLRHIENEPSDNLLHDIAEASRQRREAAAMAPLEPPAVIPQATTDPASGPVQTIDGAAPATPVVGSIPVATPPIPPRQETPPKPAAPPKKPAPRW